MTSTPPQEQQEQEDELDEGNVISQVSSRFMRMVATPPKEINDKVIEWTSQSSPAQGHTKVALVAVPVQECLHNGIAVTKISSYGKFKQRILTVSRDKFALFITHQRIQGNAVSHIAKRLPLPLFSRKGIRGFTSTDLREQYVRYIDVADIQGCMVGVVDTLKLESSREYSRLKGLQSTVDMNHDQIVTIFHHGHLTLDVLVENAQHRQALVTTILDLVHTFRRAREHVSSEARLLRYIWYDLDKNHDGQLDCKEFALLLNRINLQPCNNKTPAKLFTEFKHSQHIHTRHITYRQCMDLLEQYKQTSCGGQVGLQLWSRLFGNNEDYVSPQVFLTKFLNKTQYEMDVTEKDVVTLFKSMNTMELNRDESSLPVKEGHLSKFRFVLFLHHSINNAYNPDTLVLHQTLNQPMSQYWINTSHNTYLTGDQLQSTSSVEGYVRALRRGCKCLEFDCWDGDNMKDGTPLPVVFHGHTLTTKILLVDILKCVQTYIQDNPETFPIILSLENHCSMPFQKVMASQLKETLGDVLYIPSVEDKKDGDLPSPLALRGKVIIKGKRPPEPDDAPVVELADDYDPYAAVNNTSMDSGDSNVKADKKENTAKSHSKILPELAAMTLFHGTKYKSFETSIGSPPSYMHSISEPKITKIIDETPENASLWRMYNVHHMTRTYPAGARVDSSNYNPVLAWAMGCQMVALNFQTNDTPLLLNDGRFRQNGGCGYVLKPLSVLGMAERQSTTTLKVRVLSGTCLPKPDGDTVGETIDPYVTVSVHDVVTSENASLEEFKTSSHSTSTIDDNGFHPVWNEQEFHEFAVEFPEVAMVQFSLMDTDVALDDKVADASIPFSCLRRGYRSIQLHDRYNTRTGPFSMATLLVEIDYE